MYKAIENFINENNNGLFLLDSPTGFGKTTAVLEVLKDFLSGKKFQNAKKMFFVTNLKTNLPRKELFEMLNDEEKKQVLIARSYEDSIIENFKKAIIPDEYKAIKESDEYKELEACIEDRRCLTEQIDQNKKDGKSYAGLRKINNNLKHRIVFCELQFRKFLQKEFFFGKSFVEKKNFIKNNTWFAVLYPVSRIEEYKVVILTTKKFFSPINVFYRMPFYTYTDSIIKDSVVFIDEFDATKKEILNQIIEESVGSQIDAIKLFKNIHFALQNVEIPENLLRVTNYNKEKIEAGKWDPPTAIIEKNKEKFAEKFKQYNFDYLLKSFDFKNRKAFLFDDGRHITVLSDNSTKYLLTNLDTQVKFNKLTAENLNSPEKALNTILKEILYCINYFAEGVKRLSKNYHYFKNTTKHGYEEKYNYEEAVKTILEVFNIPEEFNDYLFKLITQGKLDNFVPEGVECRKGFKFTEVEDSNYHDLQSLAHTFNFNTTPEDLLTLLAHSTRVAGVSATATLKTVIGNYDLDYIKKTLGDGFISQTADDRKRIGENFAKTQEAYTNKIKIKVDIIDNLNCFSDKEKCKLLLGKIYLNEYLEKYLQSLESEADFYYHFQTIKLVYLYKMIGVSSIYSFIAFLNSKPTKNGKINTDKLDEMFKDAAVNNDFDKFRYSIVYSDVFDYEMEKVYNDLKQGKKCFVITTYPTIGTGKNIQYDIPEMLTQNIVYDKETKHNTKDFDGIYLSTPTHLTQQLKYDSENKYIDISKFLFQQEYLYFNKLISYGEMRYNIINGFKRLFFSDKYNVNYNKNQDIYLHTAQYIIQAVGRICRCRHKNKEILIVSDLEILERMNLIKEDLESRLLNTEFAALLTQKTAVNNIQVLEKLTKINKSAYVSITHKAKTVRSSAQNISKWKDLRDYVLKNPTAAFVIPEYNDWYFELENKQSGYSYKQNSSYSLTDLKFDTRLNMKQVSETDCDLPMMLSLPYITELFDKEKYAKSFKENKFIMSISLYKQIYKGALGEVVGKAIIEKQCGFDLEELEDQTYYEFFDYKYKNMYFDFKHWDEFIIDADKYVQKVQRKLNKIKGEKCVVVNIVKRGEHIAKTNIDDTVIQIPYLINDETGDVSPEMIGKIDEAIIW